MDGTPPTPATSTSLFVFSVVLLAGLVMVLTLLVVRRRHHRALTLALGLLALGLVAVGLMYATLPPTVTASGSSVARRCPYDRLGWANMDQTLPTAWLPCRQAARHELELMALGAGAVTAFAGAAGLQAASR